MSEITAQTPVDDPALATPDGEIESGEQSVETGPEPWTDWETYQDQYIPLDVDGTQELVKLSDLRSRGMLHADYTQKTQALAAEREQLSQARIIYDALEQNPEQAIKLLTDAYLEGQRAQQGQPVDEEPVFLSDEERQIYELRQQVEDLSGFRDEYLMQQEVAQVRQQLDQIVSATGVDENELVQFAMQNNIGDLQVAYSYMKDAKQYAADLAAQQAAQAEQARLAAKGAAGIVEGGGGRNPNATGAPTTFSSFEEAARAAMKEHGLTFD